MSRGEQKMLQYLNEAHASEEALVRVLQSQIAMSPRGQFREGLESHLTQTRGHADRLQRKLTELGDGDGLLPDGPGLVRSIAGQVIGLSKAPLDLVRGRSGEEKVLKNAKDACATEALEIATYTAIERLAQSLDDPATEELAASILADERKMLDRLLHEIPRLTDAVVGAEIDGNGSYDVAETGAADSVRETGRAVRGAADRVSLKSKSAARQARHVPGVARAEGQVKGAVASEGDLAIGGYDNLTAAEIVEKLSDLPQIDLAKIDSYERRNHDRTTILSRITSLRADEPWPGYDELTVSEIRSALDAGDESRISSVRSYERAHKNRSGVIEAVDRGLSHAT